MEIGIIILKMVLGIKIMFNIIVKKMKIYIRIRKYIYFHFFISYDLVLY